MNPIVRNDNKLKWKFENLERLPNTGLFSSLVEMNDALLKHIFTIDSIEWKIVISKDRFSRVNVNLYCYPDNSAGNWICEVNGKCTFSSQERSMVREIRHCCRRFSDLHIRLPWSDLFPNKTDDLENCWLTVEYEFSSKYYNFSERIPNFTDVTIKVDHTDFHLNKKTLASGSKYFYDMFMSNAEVDSSELIELDVDDKHFCYLLASFDPFWELADTSWTCKNLIKLANRFGVQSLHQKCENYLIKTERCNTMEKIVLADANNYEHLMKTCIDSLRSLMEIKELQGDEKFLKLKDSTRAQIMGRCAEFLKENQEDVIKIANRLKNSSLKTSNSVRMDPIVKNGNKLRWKFENVEDLTHNYLYSDKFSIESVDWKISIRTGTSSNWLSNYTMNKVKFLAIHLCYDSDNKEKKNWICEVEAKIKLLKQDGDRKHIEKELNGSRCYHQISKSWGYSNFAFWSGVLSEKNGYLVDNSIMVEVDFNFRYYDFSKKIPNVTDIIVNVEDTEFHLNKWALGSRSTYFYDLIVNTKPNEQTVIKLDNVTAKHFCFLLASFYPFFNGNLVDNYAELLDVAKQFGVSSLHYKIEQYLVNDTKLELIVKIKYAEDNEYENLMKSCIQSLTDGLAIKALQSNAKFAELKDTTKSRIKLRCLDFS